jgi:hypothetical protein
MEVGWWHLVRRKGLAAVFPFFPFCLGRGSKGLSGSLVDGPLLYASLSLASDAQQLCTRMDASTAQSEEVRKCKTTARIITVALGPDSYPSPLPSLRLPGTSVSSVPPLSFRSALLQSPCGMMKVKFCSTRLSLLRNGIHHSMYTDAPLPYALVLSSRRIRNDKRVYGRKLKAGWTGRAQPPLTIRKRREGTH